MQVRFLAQRRSALESNVTQPFPITNTTIQNNLNEGLYIANTSNALSNNNFLIIKKGYMLTEYIPEQSPAIPLPIMEATL